MGRPSESRRQISHCLLIASWHRYIKCPLISTLMALDLAHGVKNSGKSVHWELSGEVSLCGDRIWDLSLCTSASHDVQDVIETNPNASSKVRKKTEEKSWPETERRGKYGSERETKGHTEREGFPSSMRLDKQKLAWRAALASFLSHRFSRLRRKEKPQVAPIRALRLPSWHQQSLLTRLRLDNRVLLSQ